MGLKTGWVSRLGDNPLGRRVAREIHSFGVDTTRVIWAPGERNEVFFVEYGASPRGIQVIYDRGGAAVTRLTFDQLDLDYLLDTRVYHATGILAALSATCRDTALKAMQAARAAGVQTSFDVNYRSKLWDPTTAAAAMIPFMQISDILFVTREDAADLFQLTGDPEEVVRRAHERFRPQITVITLGGEGAIAYDGRGFHRCGSHPVDTVDRLGAGDCFTAGFLCGYLEGSAAEGMRYGSAMAAIKLGIRGDYFLSDRQEVLRVLAAGGGREVGR
jgi:2-dehydro-3-deoxygluconokinase